MSQTIQNASYQRSSGVRNAAEVVGALWFLWRESRLLPRQLKEARQRPVPKAVHDAYLEHQSQIETIYGSGHVRRGLLHHGTGALQYAGDKYGAGMTGQLRRPLDTILAAGLSPHTDPWALTQGSAQSVSFATAWSYAKFYANVYQPSDDPLGWEYGDGTAWFSYFIVDTARQSFKHALLTGNLGQDFKTLRQTRQPKATAHNYNRLQRWALDVRSDITPQTSTPAVIGVRTDIPGNFGAIITVSEADVPLEPMGLGGTYEKRAVHLIRPEHFTALAVPLNKVTEYSTKVHRLGYSFPVLPIEAIEYHMSRFPLPELTHAQRID